jgi:DNA-binding CsgD family transcriptional regulator
MPHENFSYRQYLELMNDSSGIKMQEESKHLIERFRGDQQKPSRFAPVIFLVDYTTKKYVHMDEGCFNLLGYSPGHYYETGVEDYLKSWHSADYDIINEKVFPDNLKFLEILPREKYANIIFSYNYRALNAKGQYVTVMQRCSYIPSYVKGTPCGVIGVAIDITHYKNDVSIVHTIEEAIEYNGSITHELLFKRIHPIYEGQTLNILSKRELEILQDISTGLSSKQIADKTDLSINTVNNHRKNMLSKMSCKSASELTNYATKHGLL